MQLAQAINVLLYTNDLELGTTLSEQLLYGNNKITFIDNLKELNNDANMLIIDLDTDGIKPDTIMRVLMTLNKLKSGKLNLKFKEGKCVRLE